MELAAQVERVVVRADALVHAHGERRLAIGEDHVEGHLGVHGVDLERRAEGDAPLHERHLHAVHERRQQRSASKVRVARDAKAVEVDVLRPRGRESRDRDR